MLPHRTPGSIDPDSAPAANELVAERTPIARHELAVGAEPAAQLSKRRDTREILCRSQSRNGPIRLLASNHSDVKHTG